MDRHSPRPERRLLIVEDEDALRRALRRAFTDDYEVLEARDGIEGLKLAKEQNPQAIISDQRMPNMSGVDLLSQIRSLDPGTVRILITGYPDYRLIVSAVNAANIHHYFEKPFNMSDLRIVVDTLVRNAELEAEREDLLDQLVTSVRKLEESNAELKGKETQLSVLVTERTEELRRRNEELQQANYKLREMAIRDGLTGLFNHRALVEQLDLEVSRSERYNRVFSLLFLDIDDFKAVNDTFGHRAGDAVLEAVGEALSPGPEGLRHSDFSARYGGEEFCVILPETPRDGAGTTANRIREGLEQRSWAELLPDRTTPVTVSIGVATFPTSGRTTDALLRAADEALYRAKREGKNRVIDADAPRREDEPPEAGRRR